MGCGCESFALPEGVRVPGQAGGPAPQLDIRDGARLEAPARDEECVLAPSGTVALDARRFVREQPLPSQDAERRAHQLAEERMTEHHGAAAVIEHDRDEALA